MGGGISQRNYLSPDLGGEVCLSRAFVFIPLDRAKVRVIDPEIKETKNIVYRSSHSQLIQIADSPFLS